MTSRNNHMLPWIHCSQRSRERYGIELPFHEYVRMAIFLRERASSPGPNEHDILVEFDMFGRTWLAAWNGKVILTLLPRTQQLGRLIEIVS